jgi:hypothetical protein
VGGESNHDEVILKVRQFWHEDVTLKQDAETLVVNGRRLQRGKTYSADRFFPSNNPWPLLKVEWRIRNGGLYPNPAAEGTAPTETLAVGGGVTEGWAPNLLGELAMVAGIVTLLLATRGLTQEDVTSRPRTMMIGDPNTNYFYVVRADVARRTPTSVGAASSTFGWCRGRHKA